MLQASLKVLGGKHDGEIIPLRTAKFLIGRESDCHLRPSSEMISRHHCAFTIDDYTVRLRDLGSTNGTFVNGQRIRGSIPLKAGDTISVGKLTFQLLIGEEVASEPSETPSSLLMGETAEMSADETHYELPALQKQPESPTQEQQNSPSPESAGSVSPANMNETTTFAMPPAEEPAEKATVPPAAPVQTQPPPAEGEASSVPGPSPTPPPAGAPYPYPGPYPPQPGYYPPPGYLPAAGYYPAYPQQPYPYPQPVVMGQQPYPGQPVTTPPAEQQPPEHNPPASGTDQKLPQVRLPDPSTTGAPAEGTSVGSNPESGGEKKPADYAADIIRRHLQRRPLGDEE